MENKTAPVFDAAPKNEKKDYTSEGIIVLATDITVPVLSGGRVFRRAVKRLNRYYEQMAREKIKYAEKHLLPAAVKAHAEALDEGRLLPPFVLTLRYTITLKDAERGVLSLYTDVTETTASPGHSGRETVTLRYADTFSLKDGLPLSAMRLRDRSRAVRRCRELSAGWKLTGRIGLRFRRGQCCRLADGHLVFFQPGEILPPEQGVVPFVIEA